MEEPTVVNVSNLNKTFKIDFWKPRNHVLKDVTFSVRKGEVYGFLGHNGAGKTTTIKILMDLIRRDSGEVSIWGSTPGDIAIKKRIGYLPENPSFYDHLTGEEFLFFYAELHGLGMKERSERIDELMELVGLSDARKLKLKKYSKGMIQRIGLAQTLVNDPELLILDEPLSGLDPIGRHDLREIIMKENERGKTIFFSSHLLSDVELVCDYVTILIQGRVVSTGRIPDLVSTEIESWDVAVASSDIKKIADKKSRIYSTEDEHLIRIFRAKDIEPLIKKVFKAGGQIKEIRPNKKTLEEIFINEMKREAQNDS